MPNQTKRLLQMVKAKEEARQVIKLKSDKAENVEELRSYQRQLEDLNKDIEELRSFIKDYEDDDNKDNIKDEEARKKQEELQKEQEMRTKIIAELEKEKGKNGERQEGKDPEDRSKDFNPITGFHTNAEGSQEEARTKAWHDKMEERGKALKENRSITVSTAGIVIPSAFGSQVNGTFKLVSSLIDLVNVMPLNGGESYRQPYEKDTPAAGYGDEGDGTTKVYNDTDKTYGYADINKSKITAYSEITNEITKLPAANYADLTLRGITTSCRRYISQQILVGDGANGHLVGIFSDKATAIDSAKDKSISVIDNTTLDTIIFAYGGDEAVEGQAVLILNKNDLAAFSRLRTADGKKFHTIMINADGGTGTIDGIPYIINSACFAISDSGTASGKYCMAYGKLQAYQMAIFSDLDVQRSKDFKFAQGMIDNRG